MTRRDIASTINDFATAAANATRAGFDGVQLQAGYSYLISQFLNPATNRRSDGYGGTITKRARMLFDVIDAVGERIDIGRVGVKAGPAWAEAGLFRSGAEALATAEYVADKLDDHALSHWLLMGAMANLADTPLHASTGDAMFAHFRPRFRRTLIANVGMTQARGNQLLSDDAVDLAYGQPFIANPDLPQRFALNAETSRPDPDTFYTPGAHGYTDYPRLNDPLGLCPR